MALLPDPSDELEDVANRFTTELESTIIPQFVSDVVTLKQLRDEITGEEAELAALLTRLQEETAFFFDLKSADDPAQQMDAMLKQEEQEREEAQRELRQTREAKKATTTEMSRVAGDLDGLQQERKRLEWKKEEWEDKTRKETSRVVRPMMRTKFRLDRDGRCVSLVLDNDLRVESVILVPEKENAPQSDLNNTLWDKLSKIYKL